MTVKTEGGASASPAARASGKGSARAGTAEQLSRADRVARGKDARAVAPLESHAEFAPDGPRDPVGLLLGQAKSRVPELVPVRHGRMLVSPFTFYRGAALPMAADLATHACLGAAGAAVRGRAPVQLRGVRLAGTAAGLRRQRLRREPARARSSGTSSGWPRAWPWPDATTGSRPRPAARSSWRRPRDTARAMRAFADQPLLEVWYAHLDIEQAIGEFRSQMKAKRFKKAEALLAKAHTKDSTLALRKLTTVADGQRRIISDPADDHADRRRFRRRAGRRDLPGDPHRAGQVPADPAV